VEWDASERVLEILYKLSIYIYIYTYIYTYTAVAQWSRCCATNRKVAGSIPAGVTGFFVDIKSFRSDSNRNEYQEHFLRVKADGA